MQETLGPPEDAANWEQFLGAAIIMAGICLASCEAPITEKLKSMGWIKEKQQASKEEGEDDKDVEEAAAQSEEKV